MEEIYVNTPRVKAAKESRPSHLTGPSSPHSGRLGAAVVCLGLLSVALLAGLVGLAVLYQNSAADLSTLKANLTNLLLSVSEDRELLNISLSEKNVELDQLQRLLRQKKTCPAGWMMFSFTCYLFSTESDSWLKGRQHCTDRGADLVIINTHEEQKFLTKLIHQDSWIGLNDRDEEGTWKWVDGTPLVQEYWRPNQPDNGGGDLLWGEEDCVHIIAEEPGVNWNDLSCDVSQQWICEKMAV